MMNARKMKPSESEFSQHNTASDHGVIEVDHSVEDARWLLAFVAGLAFLVFATGLAAAAIGA